MMVLPKSSIFHGRIFHEINPMKAQRIMTCQDSTGLQGAFLVQSEGQVHGNSALAHTTFTCAAGRVLEGFGAKRSSQDSTELGLGQPKNLSSANHCVFAFSDTSWCKFVYSTFKFEMNLCVVVDSATLNSCE